MSSWLSTCILTGNMHRDKVKAFEVECLHFANLTLFFIFCRCNATLAILLFELTNFCFCWQGLLEILQYNTIVFVVLPSRLVRVVAQTLIDRVDRIRTLLGVILGLSKVLSHESYLLPVPLNTIQIQIILCHVFSDFMIFLVGHISCCTSAFFYKSAIFFILVKSVFCSLFGLTLFLFHSLSIFTELVLETLWVLELFLLLVEADRCHQLEIGVRSINI